MKTTHAFLDAELSKRNAKTFGTIARKRERLRRFIEHELKNARVTRSTSMSRLLKEHLGW
jgi:hypothetical protein